MLTLLQGMTTRSNVPPMMRKSFEQKVPLEFEAGKFLVRTVRNEQELAQILDLRKEVFHLEFARRRFSWRSDRDHFDEVADHLAIIDQETDKLIGTYRLICSHFSERFYSATEYWIDGLMALDGIKLELSRACIHKDYRNGAIISLLWKAIAQYSRAVDAAHLFGLSSIASMNLQDIVAVYRLLQKQGVVNHDLNVIPREKYAIRELPQVLASQLKLEGFDLETAQDMVPSLLKSYLKAGAKVCSFPVIDQDFNCADFLTLLTFSQMSPAFVRRFMGTSELS